MSRRDLSRIGRSTKRHLEDNPDVLCFSKPNLDVYFVKDFIPEYDRRVLKEMIKADMSQSGTLGGSYPIFSDFRTSSTSHLSSRSRIVQSVDERISEALGLDTSFGESLQGQHYSSGQTFKPHCDFFYKDQDHWNRARREGGQRTWTAMAYLDDDMDGGDTRFVNVRFKVRPVAGLLVIWNNMTPEGDPNWQTLHEGSPVTAGEKTIVTKWFRERRWVPRPPKGMVMKADMAPHAEPAAAN